MSISMDKLAKELKAQITASDDRKPKPFDSQAEVLRVEGDIAWVHIPGGVQETPVRLTINAKKGDMVNIHVANGTAWITGNTTSPPTDDSVANQAIENTIQIENKIVEVNKYFVNEIEAQKATIDELEADTAKIHDLTAEELSSTVGYIDDLTTGNISAENIIADHAVVDDLDVQSIEAATGYIGSLTAGNISAQDIISDHGTIETLDSNYAHITNGVIDNADIDVADVRNLSTTYATIENLEANYAHITDGVIDNAKIGHADVNGLNANYAHVTNGTIDNAKIGHADVNGLNANYAHITNGTIDNAKIGYADVNNLDAHYAAIDLANVDNAWIENGVIKNGAISDAQIIGVSANKLTAGTIDASNITVTNLNASNITTGTINGQRIGTGSLSLDKLADAVYTESEIDGMLSTMQAEIDGAIETFTGTVVPTLNNAPASSWTTADEKAKHVGDVYYVVNAASQADGYCYRFAYDTQTSTYSWVLIKDSDVTAALQRLIDAEGDISDLQEFESETSSWISNTDEELSSIKSNHTSLVTVVDKTIKESVQLWFTKANTTAPSKPTAEVTNNNATGSNSYNKWNLAVPQYNASYPNYFYCYQWKYVDNTFGWSAVTRDIAMGETQSTARTAASDASSAVSTANTASSNASAAVSTANTASSNASAAVSTANTANSNASTALSTANSAATDASAAVSTANSASSTATSAQNTANANIKSTVPLWFTKANTTAPSKPTAHVTNNNATGSNSYNKWNLAVPEYNASYPNYFYCYEYQKGDNTYSWSDVVLDRATTENQANARSALTQVATKVETSTFNTLSQTVDSNSATITSLTTATTNLRTDLDNLEIGGRNFIIKSKSVDGWIGSGGTIHGGDYKSSNYIEIENGETYVWQSWTTSTAALWAGITYFDQDKVYVGGYGGWYTNVPHYVRKIIPGIEGTKYARLSWDKNFYQVKFEKGKVPTDWSPASEDTDASITTVSNTVNNVSQKADANEASISSLTQTVASKADGSTVNTLSQTVNNVQQTTNSNSAKITSLTTTLGTNADGTTKSGDIVHRTSAVEQDLSGFKTTVSNTYHKTSDFNTFKTANDTAIAAAKKAGDDAQADLNTYKGTVEQTYATKSALTQTESSIKSEVSSTYATKTSVPTNVSQLTNDSGYATTTQAQGYANTAEGNAKADTTEKLKSYSTTAQMNSAIDQRANAIELSVSQTYTTKTEFDNLEIGGRNLLAPEYLLRNYYVSGYDGKETLSFRSFSFINVPVDSSINYILQYWQPENSNEGDDRAWGSFWWKDAEKNDISLQWNGYFSEAHKTLEFKPPTNAKYVDMSYYLPTNSLNITGGTWTYNCPMKMKFEAGDKATDWTPASEDVENYADSSVSSFASRFTVTPENISSEVSSLANGSEIASRINQTANNVKIQANKVEIDGTAVFNAISSKVDKAITDKGYATTSQIPDISGKADKSASVAEEQRIYYRSSSSTKPNGVGLPTAWVTETGDKYNANATTSNGWSRKITPIANGTGSNVTKYLYLWTCIQKKTVSGTVTYGDILLDDSTTVIDGEKIVTGSVSTNAVSATSGTFDTANIPNLNASKITAGDISADRMMVNSISAINNNTGTVKISANKVAIDGAATFSAIKSQADATYDAIGAASAVQTNLNNLENGLSDGRNLVIKANLSYGYVGSNGNIVADGSYRCSDFIEIDPATSHYVLHVKNTTSVGRWLDDTYFDANKTYIGGYGGSHYASGATLDVSGTAFPTAKYVRISWHKDFTEVKVEKGQKPTGWSLAPEDMEASKGIPTLDTAYSTTYATLLSWAKNQFTGSWTTSSPIAGIKAGDTVRVRCKASDANNADVYIVGVVNFIDSATTFNMTSLWLDSTVIDGGTIVTGKVAANHIAVNDIVIGQAQVDGLSTALDGKQPTGDYSTKSEAQGYANAAANTANYYITDIDSNNGITIKPLVSTGNDYLQINSSAIDFYRNGTSMTHIEDASVRIGDTSNNATITANGMNVYQGAVSIAQFGDTARVGKANYGHVEIDDTGMVVKGNQDGSALSGSDEHSYIASTAAFIGAESNLAHIDMGGARSLIYSTQSGQTVGDRYHGTEIITDTEGAYFTADYATTSIQARKQNKLANVTVDIDASNASHINMVADSIQMNGNSIADFVTSQGTSGIWTYRVWNSGIKECWGAYTASIAVTTSSPGYGGYRSGSLNIPAFPVTFTNAPTVTATVGSAGGVWVNNVHTITTTGGSFYLSAGASSAATNRTIYFHVIGK